MNAFLTVLCSLIYVALVVGVVVACVDDDADDGDDFLGDY